MVFSHTHERKGGATMVNLCTMTATFVARNFAPPLADPWEDCAYRP